MRRRKARWILSGLVALGAVLLTWVLTGESSPLADYFLFHVGLPNVWRALNAFPFIAAAVISGNLHGGPDALFIVLQFAQWFVIAFGLSTVFSRLFRHPSDSAVSGEDK